MTCPQIALILSFALRHATSQKRLRPQARDVRNRNKTVLRRVRLELDITQEAMAEQMGIARTTYNALENNNGGITLKLARLVAKWTERDVFAVLVEYGEAVAR